MTEENPSCTMRAFPWPFLDSSTRVKVLRSRVLMSRMRLEVRSHLRVAGVCFGILRAWSWSSGIRHHSYSSHIVITLWFGIVVFLCPQCAFLFDFSVRVRHAASVTTEGGVVFARGSHPSFILSRREFSDQRYIVVDNPPEQGYSKNFERTTSVMIAWLLFSWHRGSPCGVVSDWNCIR